MTDPLTPPDPKPDSDQAICENCETIVDNICIIETQDDDSGCTECISRCAWCGKFYFAQDMFDCPFYGFTCNSCMNENDYQKAVQNKVIQNALRCYFDETECKRIENRIIVAAQKMGYYDLANEMCKDIK